MYSSLVEALSIAVCDVFYSRRLNHPMIVLHREVSVIDGAYSRIPPRN